MAIDVFAELLPSLLIPTEAAKVILQFNSVSEIGTNLYKVCQGQELLNQFKAILTYKGFTGMITRILFGLQSEIPYYYTKQSLSTSPCIVGQSWAKMFTIVFAWSI